MTERGPERLPQEEEKSPEDRAAQWEVMMADPRIEQERIRSVLEDYQERADELELKPTDTSDFLLADGMVEIYPYAGEIKDGQRISVNTELNTPGERLEHVGTYTINNGILTFINEKGQQFVGPVTEGRVKALKSAGYKEGSLYVPFSSAGRPATPEELKEWKEFHPEVE